VVAGLLLDKEKAGSGFSSLIVGVKQNDRYKYIGLVATGVNKNALSHILTKAKPATKSIFSPNVNKQVGFRKKIEKPEVIWLEPN
jgi:ATP-dependent DNA ligase